MIMALGINFRQGITGGMDVFIGTIMLQYLFSFLLRLSDKLDCCYFLLDPEHPPSHFHRAVPVLLLVYPREANEEAARINV